MVFEEAESHQSTILNQNIDLGSDLVNLTSLLEQHCPDLEKVNI